MNSFGPAASRVLVIDDAVTIHEDFRKILARPRHPPSALLEAHEKLFGASAAPRVSPQFAVDCAAQGRDGLTLLQQALAAGQPYAVAFVDMRMPPGWDGIETIRHLWAADPTLQVVICTAYSDHTWEDTIAQLGAPDNLLILKKPFDAVEVLQIAHALSTKSTVMRRDRERLIDLDERVRQRTLELTEAEGRFTRIFHANPVATALQTIPDGRYVDANPAFLQLVGFEREQLIQRTCTELDLWSDASVWQAILDSLERQTPLRCHQARLRTVSGALRDVLISVEAVHLGAHACVVTTLDDITDLLLLEQKFQQAQKMEAVGQLASGVAHDFNNLLTVIQSYTSVMLEDRGLALEHRDAVGQIRKAAERAAALTRQLLVFTRRQITRMEPLQVPTLLAHMKDMLRRLVPEHIELAWNIADDLPPILGDQANLEQVIMNLVVNARDAMPGGGRILFSAVAAVVESKEESRHPDAKAGAYVRLSVADNGSGMPPEVLGHIFEPFFTTKGVGKGTGLGLSTVYAIVRQHGGWIEVSSTPALGTTFHLFLPSVPVDADEPPAPLTAAPAESLQTGKGERILLVEDEESVRMAASAIATRAGYTVTAVEDPTAALQACDTGVTNFDLLVTDMVMPNGSGADLAATLRRRNPRLKVMIMTGYSRELLFDEGQPAVKTRILLKPFTAMDFLAAIRETLDLPV